MSEKPTLTEEFREVLNELLASRPTRTDDEVSTMWRDEIVISAMHQAWRMGFLLGVGKKEK